MKVIVVSSTFRGSSQTEVPKFVDEQIIYLKENYPDLDFHVLAPHFGYSSAYHVHPYFTEYRFHYFWPYKYESLVGHGIIPAINENKLRVLLIPFFIWFEFVALLKLCRKIKPDLIYAHWFTPQGINAGIVSLITGIPFAYMNHASDVEVLRKIPLIGRIIVRYFSKRAKAITTSGKRTFDKFKWFFNEEDIKKVNLKIIPMGIDFSKYDQVSQNKSELKIRYSVNEKKVVLFIGRLVEVKGVSYLLKAFKILHDEYNDMVLIIAGVGQHRAKLEEEASNLKISNQVIFTGFISGQKKTDFLHLADILIIPSIITKEGHAEGLPVVLMEGLAAGKLIVATYESNADEIITDGENGFLVRQKNPTAIVKAVDRIMKFDETRTNEVIARAIESAKAFDWNTIVKRHYDFVFDKSDSKL